MDDFLSLATLPDLPQRPFLETLATALWQDEAVVALWLGGSLARGAGDAHSDVDLRVAVRPDTFTSDRMPDSAARLLSPVAGLTLLFGPDATLFHVLLADGQIYDLWVQTTDRAPSSETRLVLGCRDAGFAMRLVGGADPVTRFTPADPTAVREILDGFWLSQRKHIKVLARGLPLGALEGERRMRQDLIRLWFIAATGMDCGPPGRATIHTYTPVIRAVQERYGADALAFHGEPMRSEGEIREASRRLRQQFASVGRELADRLGFVYPEEAEETVERCWQEFYDTHRPLEPGRPTLEASGDEFALRDRPLRCD